MVYDLEFNMNPEHSTECKDYIRFDCMKMLIPTKKIAGKDLIGISIFKVIVFKFSNFRIISLYNYIVNIKTMTIMSTLVYFPFKSEFNQISFIKASYNIIILVTKLLTSSSISLNFIHEPPLIL